MRNLEMEKMAEYIERAALLKKLKEAGAICDFGEHLIEQFPAADVAPVVHGHRVDDGGFYARCSQCDGVLPLCANYRPNCGAKMDGGGTE